MPIPENVPPGKSGDAPGLFKVAGNRVWVVGGPGLVLISVNGVSVRPGWIPASDTRVEREFWTF